MSLKTPLCCAFATFVCGASLALALQPAEEPPTKPKPAAEPTEPTETKPKDPPKNVGEPLTKPGQLPWDKTETKPPALPAKRIESARELLHTYGIDESQLANFFHNQPIGPGEEETLYRILFRIRYFNRGNLERWQAKDVTWTELAAKPDAHRAQVFKVSGRVKRVVRVPVLKEVAERFEFDHYYQVSLQLDNAPSTVLVCARQVPEEWPLEEPLDEPGDCLGLFLKLGEPREEVPQFVFAAWRMGWYPDKVDAGLGITEDLKWLAAQGMDVGLFDAPRSLNQKPLGDSEGECFYSLLATLNRLEPQALNKHATHMLDLGALLKEPEKHHGDVWVVRGNARRVQKIIFGEKDQEFRERFGLDHYYQVDVFIPLGDQKIQFSKGPKDKDGPVFVDSFLITLCVLKVPAGLDEGKELNVDVRLPAVFYKNWEFRSKYVEKFGDGEWKMQPAPMLMGVEPVVLERETKAKSNPYFTAGILLVMVVSMMGIWIGVWQFSRGDKQLKTLLGKSSPDNVGPPK